MLILVLIFAPIVVVWLTKRYKFLKDIGAIALCYFIGFLFAVLPINYDKNFTSTVASVSVALAIPIILFTFDLSGVKRLAKQTMKAFILLIISVVFVSCAFAVVSKYVGVNDGAKLSGMAIGLYVGGTPNLFAIGDALFGKNSTNVSLANIADSLFGGLYYFLLILFVVKIYSRFLGKGKTQSNFEKTEYYADTEYDYKLLPKDKNGILKLILVILLGCAVLGVGVLIEYLVNGNIDGSLFIMVTVSVLGTAISLIKPIRRVKGTYQVGHYLILVFTVFLGLSVDFNKIVNGILPSIAYFGGIQILSIVLHFILCKIFKIDGATAVITATAGIYGPPFIPPVAKAYGDVDYIPSGIICGTLGLVIGNILGISFGLLLGAIV